MVGQDSIKQLKLSITRQAIFRLFVSLSLFVVLLGLATAQLYRVALDKAAEARTSDHARFYQTRIAELEQQWALHSRDFRVRTEYSRILEEADDATLKLQAFITVQGGERRLLPCPTAVPNLRGHRPLLDGCLLDRHSDPKPCGGWRRSGKDCLAGLLLLVQFR